MSGERFTVNQLRNKLNALVNADEEDGNLEVFTRGWDGVIGPATGELTPIRIEDGYLIIERDYTNGT